MGEAGLQDGGANAHGLDVDDLSVAYGSTTVLHGVEFSAEPGHVMGVIGPNGAGKSTLVKTLCGKVRPTSGTVTIGGRTLSRRTPRRDLIGLVPQNIALYPHLTGRENLAAFARLARLPRGLRRSRIDAALELVNMSARADTLVADMSGGMQRRVNVAAAILDAPPLVIFDEPTAGVDGPARDVIHRLAQRLARSGHGVMLITHELEAAETACDRILVLERGRVVDFDRAPDLLTRRFADEREVVVRFRDTPTPDVLSALAPFGFDRGDSATVYHARTRASEVSFVSAFMASVRGAPDAIREVSVRRPGLASLMSELQAR